MNAIDAIATIGFVAVIVSSFVLITAYGFLLATAPLRTSFSVLAFTTSPGLVVEPLLEGVAGFVIIAAYVPVAGVGVYRLLASMQGVGS